MNKKISLRRILSLTDNHSSIKQKAMTIMRSTPKRPPAKRYRVRPPSQPYRPNKTEHLESSQAQRISDKFGGPAVLAWALSQLDESRYHRDRISVYKWHYGRARGGSGGVIPGHMMQGVKKAARLMGIVLTKEDIEL